MDTINLPINNPLTTQLDEGGIWHITIFAGLAFIVVWWITHWFKELLNREEKLLLGYILIYSLFIFEYPKIIYGTYNAAFQVTAAQVFAEALLIPLGAMMLSKHVKRALPWIVGATLACVWCDWQGLFIAQSFNTAFCALAIPLLPWPLAAAIVLTALTHHGSTALLITGAQLLAFALKNKKARIAFAVGTPILLAAAYVNSGVLFNGGHRLANYERFMNFWFYGRENIIPLAPVEHPFWQWILLGVGPGSFMWVSFILDKYQTGILFLQMHSDWLQILWELGVVGLGLTVAVFIRAARNAWDNPWHLAGLFGCAAFGLTYHPLRFFPSAFLTAVIVLNCKTNSYRSHPN